MEWGGKQNHMTTAITTADDRRGMTSASNAAADLACPGRHRAQVGIEEGPETLDAAHGRKIHEALRTGNADGLDVEQRDIYESCLAIEQKIVSALFPELATSKEQPKVFREQRYWVRVPGPKELYHSAKPDVVYRVGPKGLVIEYKTLPGDVPESPQNLQLRDQAVLVRGNLLMNEIAVVVIQPLVTHSPKVCYYNAGDLKQSEEEMFARIIASNSPTAQRIPGDVQCKFCRAKRTCGEYQRWAGGMVPNMLSLLEVPIASWSPEQRSFFLDRAPIAQKWLDECIEEMKKILELDPTAIPGWELKPGATREKITNPQAVFDRFASLGGQLEHFMACISITKGELKEQVAKVTGAKGAALLKAMKTITDGCVEEKQNRPSLGRITPK